MSNTTNQMIAPLEKDDRLILERKSPLFPNRAHENFLPKRNVSECFQKQMLPEDREPFQKPRLPLEMDRVISSLCPSDDNLNRKVERRNSKTAAMMVSDASETLPTSLNFHRKYQRRNSAVETTLFPMTKRSLMDGSLRECATSHVTTQRSLATKAKPGLCIPDDFDEERLGHRLRTSLGLSTMEGKVTHDRSWREEGDSMERYAKRRKRNDW